MNEKSSTAWAKISRRTFIRRVIDAAAMATGLAFAEPFSTFRLPGTASYAAVPEQETKDTTMNYRRLGKTNIMVSEISFGCALNYGCNPLGNKLNDAIRNLYSKAFELGINFFDTSINSDKQYIEEESFRYFKTMRDKVYLATKVNDFEPKSTRASIERSLSRMDTDYLDVVFLHSISDRGSWDKGIPALEEIRKMIDEGKVRAAGVSDHSHSNLLRIGNYAHLVDVIFLLYNFENSRKAEAVISEAKSYDIGTVAIKVFTGGYKCWNDKAIKFQNNGKLQQYVSKGITSSQAPVSFVLDNPNLSSALIGMRSEAEISDNVDAASRIRDVAEGSLRSTESDTFRILYKLLNKF